MERNDFTLDALIRSMRELRGAPLGDQVRNALKNAKIGLDAGALSELVHELESDIEEHISRLERISSNLTDAERREPEAMSVDRRREVAFQSGCDFEEIESLCEAFMRARTVVEGLEDGSIGELDIKLLFGNIPGLTMPPEFEDGKFQIMSGAVELPLQELPAKSVQQEDLSDFEDLFDFETEVKPKNRLPKDWK